MQPRAAIPVGRNSGRALIRTLNRREGTTRVKKFVTTVCEGKGRLGLKIEKISVISQLSKAITQEREKWA